MVEMTSEPKKNEIQCGGKKSGVRGDIIYMGVFT